MSQQLPPGWVARESTKTGRTYYYNTATRTSQWEFPEEASADTVRASHLLVKHNKSRRPASWREVRAAAAPACSSGDADV